MADLPEIGPDGITPLVDLSRGAGAAERASAAAWGQLADTATDLSRALVNHQRGVDEGERAKLRTALDLDADELAARPEFALDPDGFQKAWAEHRKAVIGSTPNRYAKDVGAYADVIGSRKAGEIVGRAATAQRTAAKSALTERRQVLRGKLDAYAKQGPAGLQSEGYLADLAEYSDVEGELGNPLFGSSPEEAAGRLEASRAQLTTTAALVNAEMIYRTEGLAAAKSFIESTVNDPDLPLSASDRDMIANEAKQQINLIHQAEVEEARERREQERELREAQRDARDEFMLGIFAGDVPSQADVMEAVKAGRIDDGHAAAILRAAKAEQRRQASEARREARESSGLYRPALEAAAMGDGGAVRYVVGLAESGVIDPSEAAAAARDYARATRDPGYAAGLNLISTTLSDDDDDKAGAIAHYKRVAALGELPADPLRAAADAVEKYRGRRGQTLPAPVYSRGVPKSADDLASRHVQLQQLRPKLSPSQYREELRTLAAWGATLSNQQRKK